MSAAASATDIAAAVRDGQRSARDAVQASLDRIAATDARVNAFTNWCARNPGRAVRVLGLLQYWPSAISAMLNHVHRAHPALIEEVIPTVHA